MGFINTEYKDTINSLTEGLKGRLKNPLYAFNDKKPFIVNYYNRNTGQSTLDEALGNEIAAVGPGSPTKYNLINNACIYSNDLRIEQNWEQTENGLQSTQIEGEFYVLPNTFIPYSDDHFEIIHAGKPYLFKVTSVTTDTLDDGANFYKCSYMYYEHDTENISKQVTEEYEMLMDNVGTNLKSIVRSTDYQFIQKVDDILLRLKYYFKSLFYKDKVQTFICNYNGYPLYDSYMIEFMIRNDIFGKMGGEYTHVCHQISTPQTFAIEYEKTFFRCLETKNLNKLSISASAIGIDEINSLFDSRPEQYYQVIYNNKSIYLNPIPIVNSELLEKIKSNTYYDDLNYGILNIVIKYFNNMLINDSDICSLESLDFNDNLTLFYYIPATIYILERYVEKLLR